MKRTMILAAMLAGLGAIIPAGNISLAAQSDECTLEGSTQATLQGMELAVRMYDIDIGKYPDSLQNLRVQDGVPNWYGPYWNKYPVLDAWGSEIVYSTDGNSFSLASPGPDRTFGSDDDIVLVHER